MPEDKAADPAEVVDVKLAPLYDFVFLSSMYFKGNRKHFVTGFNFHKKVLLFFETTPLFELGTLETIENNLAK